MGVWNATDMITKLPIMSGECCYMFVLSENNKSIEGGGFCYPNDSWEVESLPIMGVYDDYGKLDPVLEDEATSDFVSRMKSLATHNMLLRTERERKLRDQCIPPEDVNMPNLMEWLERGELTMTGGFRVGFALVTEKTYKAILKFIAQQKNYIGESMKSEMIGRLQSNDLYHRAETWFVDLWHKRTPKQPTKNVFRLCLEYQMFQQFMSMSRYLWSPQAGAGSQTLNYDTALLVAKMIKKAEREYKKEFPEDEADD